VHDAGGMADRYGAVEQRYRCAPHATGRDRRASRHAGTPPLLTCHPQYVAYRRGEGGPIWRAIVRDLAGAWRAGDPQGR
jgi:hypothetical protein